MASLGKCLLFYLKYPAEMERLYDAEEPKDEGLPNPEEVREKIRLVGDAACRDVPVLLESCAPGIEQSFRAIGAVRRVRRNSEMTWNIHFRVAPKRVSNRRFIIGVSIDWSPPALIPWVWSRGGRRSADEIVRILGRGSRPATPGWDSGTVALANVKIPIPARLDQPVESEPLIAQVQEAFASFTELEVKAICGLYRYASPS